ncbi:hypothetical protein FA95DRAFT_1607575 [Auriscalpium vulgare]|uniref:Uncharacterized protein n=1 Tax=Auriscalpium vulgare TaxID=40419 RepID=A0ACB8RNI2_9AGAM|nr:hypothetical protein FA95DRAFT_1607575 [Auriscalpium vulgare]
MSAVIIDDTLSHTPHPTPSPTTPSDKGANPLSVHGSLQSSLETAAAVNAPTAGQKDKPLSTADALKQLELRFAKAKIQVDEYYDKVQADCRSIEAELAQQDLEFEEMIKIQQEENQRHDAKMKVAFRELEEEMKQLDGVIDQQEDEIRLLRSGMQQTRREIEQASASFIRFELLC